MDDGGRAVERRGRAQMAAHVRPNGGLSNILDGLDPQQREAVLAPRGPVCILAGAGTGKTRTITRRIAYLVEQGHVRADQVLAVTFTSRAAGELRSRLTTLGTLQAGTGTVQARTFHAAALRNLRFFWQRAYGDSQWELLDNKFRAVAQSARRTGLDAGTDVLRDLISEIDWAKSSLVSPDAYVDRARALERDTPVRREQVAEIYRTYEELKVAGEVRLLDFDDLLGYMATALEEVPDIAREFRDRYRCFVVDEFQDITPSQERLLRAWLGPRNDLTVVGDVNQTIYTFAGAEPNYLLRFGAQHDNAVQVKLESDYRSTPQIVDFANGVIKSGSKRFQAAGLTLRGMRAPGPLPQLAEYPDEDQEAAGVAAEIAELIASGVAASEIAVLYRVNSQSERIESALDAQGISYLVKGGEGFFDRPEIKQAMTVFVRLAGNPDVATADSTPQEVAARMRAALHPVGLTEAEPSGEKARDKWRALDALASLAEELAAQPVDPEGRGGRPLPGVVAALRERASARHAPQTDGVTLATIHAAKGLEWDAVFLIGAHEGNIPISHAIKKGTEAVEEETRLLYVGVTRAREHLYVSWAKARNPGGRAGRQPSSLLDEVMPDELRAEALIPRGTSGKRTDGCKSCGFDVPSDRKGFNFCADCASDSDYDTFDRLRSWRRDVAGDKPVYTVLSNDTLAAIAVARPGNTRELGRIKGIGSHKLDAFGPAILALLAE